MAETILLDDPRTVARLDSVACLFEWTRPMPAAERKRFFAALAECSDEVQAVVVSLLAVVKRPRTSAADRARALMTIADALCLNPDEEDGQYGMDLAGSEGYAAARSGPVARQVERMNTQEELFAGRLRQLMDARQMSQQTLADRIGCSQPAVSQMLNRKCRPQRRTVLRLAEALAVPPRDLWPDLDLADVLDAVAGFQQDEYVMTAEEAAALADTTRPNRPTVRPRSLPPRP